MTTVYVPFPAWEETHGLACDCGRVVERLQPYSERFDSIAHGVPVVILCCVYCADTVAEVTSG